MPKRVIIVHCWEGNSNYCWYPAVKKELEEQGFEVIVPNMPDTLNPKMKDWVPYLREIVGTPSQDIILVGHSIGSVTILRYLETLSEGEKVGGVVLVAGFTDNLGYQELSNFFTTPLDFARIKSKSDNFIFINSDNDQFVDLKHGGKLRKEIGGKLIVKHAMKHFSQEDGCTDLPDVTQAILEISK